jgi:hypothetical protein
MTTIEVLRVGEPCPVCLKPQGEGCGTVGGVPRKDCPVCEGTGRAIDRAIAAESKGEP